MTTASKHHAVISPFAALANEMVQMCLGKSFLLDNTCQYGKGGNTHGDTYKQGEREERRTLIRIFVVHEIGGQHTEKEGDDRTGMTD